MSSVIFNTVEVEGTGRRHIRSGGNGEVGMPFERSVSKDSDLTSGTHAYPHVKISDEMNNVSIFPNNI